MRHRGKHLRHIALAVAAIVIGGAATATKSEAALFTVSIVNNFLATQSDDSPNPLTRTFSTSANHTTATGTGFAGNGTLTNFITSNRDTSQFGANGTYRLTTTAAYDDIVFFDIANPTSTASAMVAVSADFTASSETPGANWGSTFQVFFDLAGSSFGISPVSILNTSIGGSLLSTLVSVSLNTPVSFSISGRTSNFLIGSSFAGQGTTINSTSEVTFATFILPEGIGVTSATLIPPSSVIPIPAALPLFLTGLAGLGLMRRRQRQA